MRTFIPLIILICCFSCKSGNDEKKSESPLSPSQNSLIEMNKNLLNSDMLKIDEYLANSELKMNKTGTGLYYNLVIDKNGDNAIDGDEVAFVYNLRNLDGQLIYSSDESGLKKFIVDKSEAEAGLNEAAKIMSEGDSAVIILSPHLAFRNIGDRNKIGPGAILIYELKLQSVIKHP